MDASKFFYKVCVVDAKLKPNRFLGCAFAVSPHGGLLTCRHVVNTSLPSGHSMAVLAAGKSEAFPLKSSPIFPNDNRLDLAFIPNAVGDMPKPAFFPLFTPSALTLGVDVYTYGHFLVGTNTVDHCYFGGKIVNMSTTTRPPHSTLTLPFAVLEGMSGSPILQYHNGVKVVGIAIGNRSSRILASETIEYKDDKTDYRETINRIVEFGVAYHVAEIENFLKEAQIDGYLVSSARLKIPGLE